MKYLILECGYSNDEERKEQEKSYYLVISNLDSLEEGEIYHNSYYLVIGKEENIEKWIKECYLVGDEDELGEMMSDLKDIEIY